MGKRVALVVIGAVLLLIGAAAAIGGAGLVIVFGPDGTASSGPHRISTNSVAFVGAVNDIKGTKGFARVAGHVRLQLRVDSPSPAFVGIGPAAAVERYLAGAPIARVTDLDVDPFRLDIRSRTGTAQPAPPVGQNFWTVSDSGMHPRVDWAISDGSYRLVVMNADATPNVGVDAGASLTVPHLFGIGLGVLIGGVVVAIIGVFLIVRGARQPPRRPLPSGQPQSVAI